MAALAIDPATIAPARLHDWQQRAIIRAAEIAIEKNHRILARMPVYAPGATKPQPMFLVDSTTDPARPHIVWIAGGRIHCDCKQRTVRHALTCSHAQTVRLALLAELADARSAPATVRAQAKKTPAVVYNPEYAMLRAALATPAPAPAPETDPDPTPPPPSGGPAHATCPTCGDTRADAREIEEIGECLNCVQMRNDYASFEEDERAREEETAAALARAEERARIAEETAARELARIAAKEATARRVIAREKARIAAGKRSEASPRAAQPLKTATAKKTTRAAKAEK